MRRYSYTVSVTYMGTLDVDDDEIAEYADDEDELTDYLHDLVIDEAIGGTNYDVDDVNVQEVAASV